MKTLTEKAEMFINDMSVIVPGNQREELRGMLVLLLKTQDKDTRRNCAESIFKLHTFNENEESLLRAAIGECLNGQCL